MTGFPMISLRKPEGSLPSPWVAAPFSMVDKWPPQPLKCVMLSFGGLNGGVTVGLLRERGPQQQRWRDLCCGWGDVELPHLWLRTDQTLFVCHAALQLPTQVQDGAFFFIVLQCRIMARLAVGMGKREGIGGRGLQTASR